MEAVKESFLGLGKELKLFDTIAGEAQQGRGVYLREARLVASMRAIR